jgi:hypothetical protein
VKKATWNSNRLLRFPKANLNVYRYRSLEERRARTQWEATPTPAPCCYISLLTPEAMQSQLEVETKKRRIINQCIKNCLVEKIDSRKIHIGVVGRSSVMSEAKKY